MLILNDYYWQDAAQFLDKIPTPPTKCNRRQVDTAGTQGRPKLKALMSRAKKTGAVQNVNNEAYNTGTQNGGISAKQSKRPPAMIDLCERHNIHLSDPSVTEEDEDEDSQYPVPKADQPDNAYDDIHNMGIVSNYIPHYYLLCF